MTSGAAYVAAVLADNPIAYWRLNDAVGPAASNLVGGGPVAVYGGTFSLGQGGPFDDATTAFFATSGYVTAATGFVSYAHFSFEFICRVIPGQACYMMMLANGATGTFAAFDVFLNPGQDFSEDIWTAPNVAQTNFGFAQYGNGAWHHVVATWDGTHVAMYVDGVADALAVAPSINAVAAPSIDLGGWHQRAASATTRANGQFGEFAYYNTVLTVLQVQTHFQALATNTSVPVGQGSTSSADIAMLDLLNKIYAAVHKVYPTT